MGRLCLSRFIIIFSFVGCFFFIFLFFVFFFVGMGGLCAIRTAWHLVTSFLDFLVGNIYSEH